MATFWVLVTFRVIVSTLPTWANVQVYSQALSAQQISALYSEGMGGTPIQGEGISADYMLAGNANDSSGNGNNGVATNVEFTGVGSASTATAYWLKLSSLAAGGSATINMKLYPQYRNCAIRYVGIIYYVAVCKSCIIIIICKKTIFLATCSRLAHGCLIIPVRCIIQINVLLYPAAI